MDEKLLLVVEDSFYLQSLGLGLVIFPDVSKLAVKLPKIGESISIPVMLKYPDGSVKTVQGHFQFVHFNPGGFKIVCSLGNYAKEVPRGTEIYQITE